MILKLKHVKYFFEWAFHILIAARTSCFWHSMFGTAGSASSPQSMWTFGWRSKLFLLDDSQANFLYHRRRWIVHYEPRQLKGKTKASSSLKTGWIRIISLTSSESSSISQDTCKSMISTTWAFGNWASEFNQPERNVVEEFWSHVPHYIRTSWFSWLISLLHLGSADLSQNDGYQGKSPADHWSKSWKFYLELDSGSKHCILQLIFGASWGVGLLVDAYMSCIHTHTK